MRVPLSDLIAGYDIDNERERENAVREIIQEMTLYGLAQTDFFENAAFMGGTDLRVLYGLNRFSEDLDFILKRSDKTFSLEEYVGGLSDVFSSFGLPIEVAVSEKTNRTSILEAVVKARKKDLYALFYSGTGYSDSIYPTQLVKVKMEVDSDPAESASFENRYKTKPFGYMMVSCDLPTMFSGKIHAILCRPWANRFKGRDLYDYIFFINKGVRYNLRFLNAKLRKTAEIDHDLSHEEIYGMLMERFGEIDYKSAVDDVVNFIDPSEYGSVRIWCSEMFRQISADLKPQ